MPRKQKYPKNTQRAQQLMNELLDMTVHVWTEQETLGSDPIKEMLKKYERIVNVRSTKSLFDRKPDRC